MHIAFIEVKNFRKLLSVRIDLEPDKTLLVGANNSGKTSAIIALRSFLVRGGDIHIRDFTIANWSAIIAIGEKWAQPVDAGSPQAPTLAEWSPILPFVDVWIEAAAEELAYVRGMLPTLDWNGGLLGVRLRFEPEDDREFAQGYLVARRHVVEATKGNGARETSDLLWPKNLFAFLEKEIGSYFVIKAYLLDPAKVKPPTKGIAHPQELTANAMPLPSNPLAGLIRIHEIGAQRGFGDSGGNPDEGSTTRPTTSSGDARKLSVQLKRYYAKHLNPFDKPTATDIDALEAIGTAQKVFDTKLSQCFASAIDEVEDMGYPGITDPILKISTRILPSDCLATIRIAGQRQLDSPVL
jgi:AAA ATPase domain